jgi:leucyl aminopeptidase
MKLTNLSLLALSASTVSARFIEQHETSQVAINGILDDEQLYLIELAPGKTRLVTEDDKWELRRVRSLIASTIANN